VIKSIYVLFSLQPRHIQEQGKAIMVDTYHNYGNI